MRHKFGGSKERKNSSSDDEDIPLTVERILRRKRFLTTDEDGNVDLNNRQLRNLKEPKEDGDAVNKYYVENRVRDAKQNRISNVGLPVHEDDAANKKYVDASVHWGYSTLIFNLRIDLEIDPEWYIFRPFGKTEYEFPFDASVRISKTDLRPGKVEVFKGDVILRSFFDGGFHYFFKGEKLRLHRIEGKNNAYLELVIRGDG